MNYDYIAIPDADVPQAIEPVFQHVVITYANEANKAVSMWQAVPDSLLDFKPHIKTNSIRTILVHQLLSELLRPVRRHRGAARNRPRLRQVRSREWRPAAVYTSSRPGSYPLCFTAVSFSRFISALRAMISITASLYSCFRLLNSSITSKRV